jgi:hypothetical protein
MATTDGAQPTYTPLLNPLAFPPLISCPHDRVMGSPYYDRASVTVRNWCFLGEIVDIGGLGRLRLDVRDREGITARIYFYLDQLSPRVRVFIDDGITDPGHPNVPMDLVKVGNTIAVLYAQQHTWLEASSVGIRIEDGDLVQVCDLCRSI